MNINELLDCATPSAKQRFANALLDSIMQEIQSDPELRWELIRSLNITGLGESIAQIIAQKLVNRILKDPELKEDFKKLLHKAINKL